MSGFFSFFSGYRVLRIERRHSEVFLNLCAARRFVYRDLKTEEEFLFFTVSETVALRLTVALDRLGIPWECVKQGGAAFRLRALFRRPGLMIGALLFAAILFFSSGVLWDVRIDGCRNVREAEVRELLRECGLSRGLWRSSIDTATIENRVMIFSDDISWISINIIGTVAQVEIRETARAPEEEAPMAAANLVAARDGMILWMEDVRGNAAVSMGDDVAEGELLVGGIYGSETDGFRYTVAKGRVYAETHRDFSVEIPLSYEKKVYTGRVKTEKYFIFFEKEVKFFGNCGNLYESCDTIDTTEYFRVFDGENLPVGIRTVRYLEYTPVPSQRSEEEARRLAEYELRCRMEAEAADADAELTALQRTEEFDGTVFRLKAHASYIENIARVQQIEIEGLIKTSARPTERGVYGANGCQDREYRDHGEIVWQF